MFWVISVYFNIRNTLLKYGTFLLGHPVYIGRINFYSFPFIFHYIRHCDLQTHFKFLAFITVVNFLGSAYVEFIFLYVLICCSLHVIHGDVSYILVNCSQISRHNKCHLPSTRWETILILAWYRRGIIYDGPTVMNHNKCYSMGR